jgi:hypothetical protein
MPKKKAKKRSSREGYMPLVDERPMTKAELKAERKRLEHGDGVEALRTLQDTIKRSDRSRQIAKYKRAKAASGKPKRNEDAIQATHRVFDEIARRNES